MDDLWDLFSGMVLLILGIGIGGMIIIGLYAATIGRWGCEAMPAQYGIESRWTFVNGCAVKTEQGWIPLSTWEQRDIQNRHELTIKDKR